MKNTENTTKKKKFNIFDWYFKGGKDNDKFDINALEKPSIVNFFKVLWKKLGKLFSANILFIFANFPIFFFLLALSGFFSENVTSPVYHSWGPLYGAMGFENTASTSIFSGILGFHTETVMLNTATKVLFGLTLLLFFTMGFAKVGTTYLYRNLMSGEPTFPFSDFFYVIKRNIKQSLILGFIDMFFIGSFAFSIYVLWGSTSTMDSVMFVFSIAMFIVYSFARPYAYIMVFTFDLKLGKIIKNALYFIILGIKRNICALIGVVLVVLINVGIYFIFQPLGIILPFIITIAICDFIGVYAAYPVILKYMLTDEDRKKVIYKIPDENDDEAIEENIIEDIQGQDNATLTKIDGIE